MIRHIVFDIGRVLIRWDPEIPYRRLIADDARREWFLAKVCSSAWNKEQDRGRSWAEAEAVLIAQYPDEAPLIRAYREHWSEMVPGEVEGTREIFDGLVAAGLDVTMLTNFAEDTFQIAQSRFPVLTRSRGVTVSAAVEMVKPDRAIYDHHVRTMDIDPAQTLFFDDMVENIDAAEAAGWHARHFTTAAQMRADLGELGVRF
ncbi:HAD family phosphatase [Acuticoccus sp. MNP-M23]|uniref:HAD family hydrolase n=1 Tax=Acuticoccus sp. MNP-M23 TaxID=3072793 RepID=UPI002815A8D6|nr:HAD family phosphatase [Acuticoccus sp. MNP-M23]WMS43220.1 HAD family phosphatase [Acuticoccus sp. MNP-M23]